MKIIDLETFPRRSHYEFFKSYAYPYMGITANVDVTNLYQAAKDQGGSPFLAFLWAAATAANSIPEMRQRIVNDQIVEYEFCPTAHTVALPDGTFVNCQTDCRRSFTAFQTHGKQCQEEAKLRHGFVQPGDDETRLIFVSSTPWITFTQVIQPTPIPADSNVRIVFGKFFDQNGRKMLPVNIQANHALVDGVHVGQFFRKFQELADSDLTAQPQVIWDPTLARLNITPAVSVPVRKDPVWKKNVLRSDEPDGTSGAEQRVFGSKYRRDQIRSVAFLDTLKQMPKDAWDVSEACDRSVMAWVKPEGARFGLFIGAEGGMCTGKSCRELFAKYIHAERITFGDVLHTEGTENMFGMFWDCSSLTELDLSSFDTSRVQDMSYMFCGCSALTELDLTSFDTSRVQDMWSMFSGCSALTELDLSSFDTSRVQDMSFMFYDCRSLAELDLSSFDTSRVQDMSYMFCCCSALTELDLSSFDTSRVQNMSFMFTGCPAGSRWQHMIR